VTRPLEAGVRLSLAALALCSAACSSSSTPLPASGSDAGVGGVNHDAGSHVTTGDASHGGGGHDASHGGGGGDATRSHDGGSLPEAGGMPDSGLPNQPDAADAAATGDASGTGPANDTGSYTPTGYHLVWEDLFDTPGTPSTTLWSMYDSVGNAGNGLRRPSAFSVHDGELDIIAQDEDGGIVSGGMSANNSETYGYYEFRVRTLGDPSQATDGVVLTWPDDGIWPEHGEEDIYETTTNPTRDPFDTFIHYGDAGSTQYVIDEPANGEEWHVMAMEWTSSVINIYRDGAYVGNVTNQEAIPSVSHHLCIQLDAYAGSIAAPTHMYVDWVMVFQM
jgi:Glycosyl hydrolases family 16